MKRIVIVIVITLFPVFAYAERGREGCPQSDQDCTEYDEFEDEDVFGGNERGALERAGVIRPGGRDPLIRVRTHFIRELVKSVEQI